MCSRRAVAIIKYIGIGCYLTATLAALILSIYIHKKDPENYAKKVLFCLSMFYKFYNLSQYYYKCDFDQEHIEVD